MAHTSHLLRPAFTRILGKELFQGAVYNLVGKEKDGTGRLLDDLLGMELSDVRMVVVDMREFSRHISDFLSGVSQAMGYEEVPEDFGEWIDALQLHGGKFCLILNHFDAIDKGEETGYNQAFFAALNRFHLIPTLSLVIVTAKPWEARLTHVEDFLSQGEFEPEVMKLPPLGFKRYQEELKRKFPEWKPDLEIVTEIYSHPLAYPFFEEVVSRLESMGQTEPSVEATTIREWRVFFDEKHGLTDPRVPASEKPWWKFW